MRLAAAVLASSLAAGLGSQAPAGVGEVALELVVEDAHARPVTDLQSREVVIDQDGVAQTIRSFRYLADKGWYELRYVPTSGRAGAVSVGVNRRGTRLRGPQGPQVTPRWIPPVQAFEVPLKAALDVPDSATALPFEWASLRFEARGDTLHHAFVAEIPLREVSVEPSGQQARAHLSFLLRVKAEDGRIVHEGSLDQPLEVGAVSTVSASVRRFVWSSHVHLRTGRYVAELAVMDVLGGRLGVRRMPLEVAPWPSGLRVGSLTFLLAASGVMAGPEEDNPLRLPELELVPMLRPTWVAGAGGALSLLAMVYPDRSLADPVIAFIELHRDGQLRSKAAVPLPAADAEGRIRYLGGLKFTSLQPGSYVLKLVAQQGAARADESAVLEVTPPLAMPDAK